MQVFLSKRREYQRMGFQTFRPAVG
jgi:hypothetical protein